VKLRGGAAFAVAGVVVLVLLLAFVAIAAFDDDDAPGVDCASFRVTPDRWAAADYDHRLQLRSGLMQCDRIVGVPSTQVIAQLGPADRATTTELDYLLPYPDSNGRQVWRIHLDGDDEVEATRIESLPGGG
jgi:hypothetical protein